MRVGNCVIVIAIFIYSVSSFAFEYECEALTRNKKHKLVKSKVTLVDLRSKDSFDGKFFKIVADKNEKAIKFDSPLAARACHVYYHMNKARDFFLANYDLKHLKRPRPLVVRIEMPLGFNDSSHFIHENLGKFYNNALTIPPSGPARLDEVKPWGHEIWFAPKKKVKVKSSLQKAAEVAASWPVMSQVLLGIVEGQITAVGGQVAQGLQIGSLEGEYYLKSLAFSVGIMALVPNVIKWTSSIFKKTIFLDSAMIPEVIYHEFTHYALSPYLSLDKHSSVVEGVANFYAAMIGKTDGILKRARKFSRGLVKVDAKPGKKYEYYMEDSSYAQLDFAFKYLYALKTEFGERMAMQMVFDAIQEIKELKLKEGLVPALFKVVSDNPSDTYRLHQVTQKFGF